MIIYAYQHGLPLPIKYKHNINFTDITQFDIEFVSTNTDHDFVFSLIELCSNVTELCFIHSHIKMSKLINLNKITTVKFSECTIYFDEYMDCHELYDLKSVTLTKCDFKILHDKKQSMYLFFSYLHNINLTTLKINKCIFNIPNEMFIKSISDLDLTKCGLTSIPNEIHCLTLLKSLNVSHNRIKKISDTLCNLNSLEMLNVSNNPIKILNPHIKNLTNLKSLNLHNTLLQSIPNKLSQLQKINSFIPNKLMNVSYLINDQHCIILNPNCDFIVPYYIRYLSIIQKSYYNRWNILCIDEIDLINQRKILNNLPPMLKELSLYTPLLSIPKNLPFGLKKLVIGFECKNIELLKKIVPL